MRNNKLFWILTVLIISLFWVGWATIFHSFYMGGQNNWLYPVATLFFATATFYLLIIITRKARTLFLVSCVATLPAIFLGGETWYSMLLIWICSGVYYVFAIKRIKAEQYARIKINIYQILRIGAPMIGTGLSFLIAGGFYFSIINQQKVGDVPRFEIDLSMKATNGMLGFANLILPTEELSWILEGISIDEYILKRIKSQEEKGILGVEKMTQTREEVQAAEEAKIYMLSEEGKNELLMINREQMAKQLGIKVTGEESMDQTINDVLNKRLSEMLNGDLLPANVVPLGVAFGMFVTVRSLTWVLNGISYLFVYTTFVLLVKRKIILVSRETREVEDIQ